MKAIILLNPLAGAGRALRHVNTIEPLLTRLPGNNTVVTAAQQSDILQHLVTAADAGYDTVLAAGGDGTNQAVVNALAALPGHPFAFGTIPLGTGQDWARTVGIPTKITDMLDWFARAERHPVDLGKIIVGTESKRFVNVASAGLSGRVVERVNRVHVKRPWTYLQATISDLVRAKPPTLRVTVDEATWYEGAAFLLAVGNGRFFGRGMKVCPDARINDGLLDIVLVEGMGTVAALRALPSLLRGTHVLRPDVHTRRARHVVVETLDGLLPLEADGEPTQSNRVEFEVLPQALTMLVDPTADAFALT